MQLNSCIEKKAMQQRNITYALRRHCICYTQQASPPHQHLHKCHTPSPIVFKQVITQFRQFKTKAIIQSQKEENEKVTQSCNQLKSRAINNITEV